MFGTRFGASPNGPSEQMRKGRKLMREFEENRLARMNAAVEDE
jgi:hypothetical protein